MNRSRLSGLLGSISGDDRTLGSSGSFVALFFLQIRLTLKTGFLGGSCIIPNF